MTAQTPLTDTLAAVVRSVAKDHAGHLGASGAGWWADCLSVVCDWNEHGTEGGMFAAMEASAHHVATETAAALAPVIAAETHTPPDGPAVDALLGAADCCRSCLGGVLARIIAAEKAAALREAAEWVKAGGTPASVEGSAWLAMVLRDRADRIESEQP